MAATYCRKSVSEALLADFASNRPAGLGASVGITTFIKKELRKGRVFSRSNPYTKPKKWEAQAGQHLGRKVDAEVRGRIEPDHRPEKPSSNAVNKRADDIMNLMKRKGLRPLKTQVLVHSAKLKIKAFIDIVAINSKNEVVVIELKSTRTSMGEHRALYQKDTDKHNRTMRNHIEDTEEHHHFLQAGFGALGLQHTYTCISSMSLKVSACVLVSCADGARIHIVPHTFMMPSRFRVDTLLADPKIVTRPSHQNIPIVKPWPTDTTGFAQQLERIGFNTITPQSQTSEYAFLSHCPFQDGARIGVAVCLGQPLEKMLPRQMTDLKFRLAQKCKSGNEICHTRKQKKSRDLDSPTRLARQCKSSVTHRSTKQKKIPIIICPGRNGKWEVRAA